MTTPETKPASTSASTKADEDLKFKTLADFNTNFDNGSVKKAMAQAGAKSSDLWAVPLDRLFTIPNFNMRLETPEYLAHKAYIKASLKANGYHKHEPMTGFIGVNPDDKSEQRIFVTEGHTRLEMAHELAKEGFDVGAITIIIKDRTHSMADITVASYHSNNGTKRYTTLETALVCHRLRVTHNRETFQIAESLGLSKAYVETLLLLARAPQSVRDLVQEGKVSASAALDTLKKNKDTAEAVLKKAVDNAEKRVAASTVTQKPAAPAAAPADPKAQPASSTTPAKAPATGTVATPKPAPAPAPAKKVVVTKADISPLEAALKKKQELGPRLFDEVQKLVNEKKIEPTMEIEKILFIVENISGAA